MATRVSERLNEGPTGFVYYPKLEIIAALNEGLRFWCLLTLGLEITAGWTPGATFTHMLTVFSDWIAPLRIMTSAGAIVRHSNLADMAAIDPSWIFATGTAQRYVAIGADFVGVYPAGGTLSVTYARAPVVLAADGDVPEMPIEYHPRLVDYGIYRMRQVEGGQEFLKSLKYFASFMDGAEHYGNYVRNRNKGADYDTGPLELKDGK